MKRALGQATGAVLFFGLAGWLAAGGASAQSLDDLRPGEWWAAPNSELSPHMPPSTDDDWGGPGSVMTAWSGGAYDTVRDRLIIWGGGHHDYAGNELYVFDVDTLAWSRLTERSTDVGGDEASGYYPDGAPRSRHTYDYVDYVPPPVDRFCSFGGSALFPSGGISIDNVDCFDFETLRWERKADAPAGTVGAVVGVHGETGEVWMQPAGNGFRLARYDPLADAWSEYVAEPSGWFDYYYTGAIDPARDTFVAVGDGEVVVWDLARPNEEPVRLQTSGATAIQGANSPGVAYDPVSDRIVAYDGGADVYSLDPDTAVWTRHEPAETNVVLPPPAADNGTFGRFRYVPSRNVFVTVHGISQNVYFYRLGPGSGSGSGGEDAGTGADGPDEGDRGGGSGGGRSAGDDSGGCRTAQRVSGPWGGGVVALGVFLAARRRSARR